MANLDGCSMSCNHFSGKSVGNFVKCPGKKQSFGVLDPLTNGENQLTKEKKKIKISSTPTVVVVTATIRSYNM